MILHSTQLPRLLVPLAWIGIVGVAAISSNYSALWSTANESVLLTLNACFISIFWLAVAIAGLDGIRRWSGDSILVRIETTILVVAAVALMGTTASNAISFGALGLLTIPWPVFYTSHTAALTSVFSLAALIGLFVTSDRAITFEATAVPALALVFPFALTGLFMGNDDAHTVALRATAASAAVLSIAFAITRDRLHVALIAGMGGVLLNSIAYLAVLVPTAALFVPPLRSRAQAAFAAGANRVTLFGAGIALVTCFSGVWFAMLSPTLRSQMDNAAFVLAMRPLPTILAACAALFVLCVLSSPLVAFSLLAAAYAAPINSALTYETQCSVIGGSVPIAIAAMIVRAEWQRSATDEWRRRANHIAAAALFVIGCICAAIPHPPYFSF
ncbi:hypothetical protein ACWAT4_11560 [Bradyrhizobium manausense]